MCHCKARKIVVCFLPFFLSCRLPLHLCRNDCLVLGICTRCHRKMSQIFIYLFFYNLSALLNGDSKVIIKSCLKSFILFFSFGRLIFHICTGGSTKAQLCFLDSVNKCSPPEDENHMNY